MVLEAVQPVKWTPLHQWIGNGKDGHFKVKRLRNRAEFLNEEKEVELKSRGSAYLGKNYDLYFNWSDEQLYCSELVWKVYQQTTGLQLGEPVALGSFDLSHPLVKAKLLERYAGKIPLEEKMVAPSTLFESPLLKEVDWKECATAY